jgi:two-component system sensor histidine kinase YesM
MFKVKTIHFKIFFRYSLLVVGIILIFLIFFAAYMSTVLRQEAMGSMLQSTVNISSALDTQLNDMYSTASKIENSDSIKKSFYMDMRDPAVLFNVRDTLSSLILTINNLQSQTYKINLYRHDGFYYNISNGIYDTAFNKEDVMSRETWIRKTIQLSGIKYISATHIDDTDTSNIPVISLSIAFSQYYTGAPQDIIEIQQPFSIFEKIIQNSMSVSEAQNVKSKLNYVIDSYGNIVYPYGNSISDATAKSYITKISAQHSKEGELNVRNLNNKKYICTYAKSDFSGWTAITVESEEMLYRPVVSFVFNIILLCIPVLIITVLLSYYISRALSSPIKRLNQYINELNLNTLIPNKQVPLKSDFDELQELNHTFLDMCKRLDESLNEVINAHSHEIQARMLAMQSQMNPHFLYNSLSAISIMCEDQRTKDAVKYCHELSNMLRYISSNSFQPVELLEEVNHTKDYTYLIKQRYEDMIEFEMDIPEQMLTINVPKLILQPLVENCIKHGLDTEPPWRIRIIGRLLSDYWIISVTDNGNGFSDEKLNEIKEKLSGIDVNSSKQPELTLGGMGLINIYVRLKLYYGSNAIFDLKNEIEGGATVTIGGSKKGGVDNPCLRIE